MGETPPLGTTTVLPIVKSSREANQPYVRVSRIPSTTKNSPAAESTAPTRSKRGARPSRAGSGIHHDDARDDDHLEQERGPPAQRGRDEAADERSRRRPEAAGAADDAQVTGPGGEGGEEHRHEDVDRRDHERRADALEQRVPHGHHDQRRREGRDQGARPVDAEAPDEA